MWIRLCIKNGVENDIAFFKFLLFQEITRNSAEDGVTEKKWPDPPLRSGFPHSQNKVVVESSKIFFYHSLPYFYTYPDVDVGAYLKSYGKPLIVTFRIPPACTIASTKVWK